MTRWALGPSVGLVIATLASLAPAAAADPAVCDCGPDQTVLPAPGTTGLPRNAKVWVVGRRYDKLDLRTEQGMTQTVQAAEASGDLGGITRFEPGDLAANQEYFADVPGLRTRFTTGTELDLVPPAQPVIRALGIAVTTAFDREHEDLSELSLDAGFDPDVALVRIELTGAGLSTITTTPGGWRTIGRPSCYTQLRVHPGDQVQVAITAIDIAGNESKPAIRTIVVTPGTADLEPCARYHHFKCGTGLAGVLFFGMILAIIAFVVVIALLVKHFSRGRALRLATPEPLSPLAGERLVRGSQVRAGLIAVLGIVGVPVFFVQFDGVGFLPILSTIVGCIGIRGFFVARGILDMIETGKADVETLGHRVVVRIGAAESHIDLTEDKIAAARRKYSVPTSIATKR